MCAGMIDLKKAMTSITELEEKLKTTRDGYEEEIVTLLEKNDDLVKKIGVFMETPRQEEKTTIPLAWRTTSSSMTPTQTPMIAMITLLMKLEQISWSLRPINFSSRPP